MGKSVPIYKEDPERYALRREIESAIAFRNSSEVVRLLTASAIGPKVLAMGFGGALTEIDARMSFASYCVRRRERGGLGVLRAVLEAKVCGDQDGMSRAATPNAVCGLATFHGALREGPSLVAPTLFHVAMSQKSPAAMALALEFGRKVAGVDAPTTFGKRTTVHFDCLSMALRSLPFGDEESTADEIECLQMLLDAKLPVSRNVPDTEFGAAGCVASLFVGAHDSVRTPGAAAKLLGRYVASGMVDIDRLVHFAQAGSNPTTPLEACFLRSNVEMAAAFILNGCALSRPSGPDPLVRFSRHYREDVGEMSLEAARAVITEALMRRAIVVAAPLPESVTPSLPARRLSGL